MTTLKPNRQYLGQWLRNTLGRSVLPLELILFVTGRCNFRCSHCFVEQIPGDDKDLSITAIQRLAADLPRLLVLMLTGGEPFLRRDLTEIVQAFYAYGCPPVLSIATNGFLTGTIIETVVKILELPEFKGQLIITLSFEGLKGAHDANRNVLGAFEKAMATARALNRLRKLFPSLAVGANLTITPQNETVIKDAAQYLKKTGHFQFLSQNLFRETKPRQVCRSINPMRYQSLASFCNQSPDSFNMARHKMLGTWHRAKEAHQAHLITQMMTSGQSQGIACEAGRGIGVVYSDGAVAPCEMIPAVWGNINQASLPAIWNEPQNRWAATKLRQTHCFCTHECFLSASLNLQPAAMARCLLWRFGLFRG